MEAKNLGMAKNLVRDINKYQMRALDFDRYVLSRVIVLDEKSGQKRDCDLSQECLDKIQELISYDIKHQADLKVEKIRVKLESMGIKNYMEGDQ